MRSTLALVRRVLDAAAAVLLVIVLALTCSQVVFRYVLGISMPWTEELTRLLFVWLVLIGASRTSHMAIDLVPMSMRAGPARRTLELGATGVGILTLLVLIRYTVDLLEIVAYDRFTALGISVQYLYWSVIVGGGLWIAMSLAELFVRRPPEPPTTA
ncbi:TRAP transporter small permease subunit [Aurantimonas aggregata]|uniref:TRAP transporter small permease protein n=1 Tax=Aurantimonas aggregata TaxID=2047720 RepID=A0A6L9MMY2_9HYPH|nr:TRAP transporter small permease [Aurantimonas aggregata]NDV89101.1 TRAP transporter small permease subunit [Aurantimonas aggregata]